MFFDHDTMAYLTNQITRYALFNNYQDPKVTIEEIKCFIGILLLTGYNNLPGKRYYWETQDVRNALVCNTIRRNRFMKFHDFYIGPIIVKHI